MSYYDVYLLSNITLLYEKVAYINNECSDKIKRSVRCSVDTMNSRISTELLRSFFHIYNNDVVTPKNLIITVVEYFIRVKKRNRV